MWDWTQGFKRLYFQYSKHPANFVVLGKRETAANVIPENGINPDKSLMGDESGGSVPSGFLDLSPQK